MNKTYNFRKLFMKKGLPAEDVHLVYRRLAPFPECRQGGGQVSHVHWFRIMGQGGIMGAAFTAEIALVDYRQVYRNLWDLERNRCRGRTVRVHLVKRTVNAFGKVQALP